MLNTGYPVPGLLKDGGCSHCRPNYPGKAILVMADGKCKYCGTPVINKSLTKNPNSVKPSLKDVVGLTEEEKHELISMLKTMEGFKRKLLLLLK
jgi:hypothetical protein